jgi:hypothetical protein
MSRGRLLLICYRFPPFPGIGGRRWAKLAKGLAARGYELDVIAARNPHPETSLWTADVASERLRLHRLPPRYPMALLRPERTLRGRLGFRLARAWLHLTQQGHVGDTSVRWRRQLHRTAAALIEQHDVRHVLVTGAPFRLFLYAAEIKERFPHLRLHLDYRDPWQGHPEHPLTGHDTRRERFEARIEAVAVARADVVTAPYVQMIEDLRARLDDRTTARFQVLEHFVDPDDLPAPASPPDGDRLEIVFGGSLYRGVGPLLAELGAGLARLRETAPALYRRVRLTAYVTDGQPGDLSQQHPDVVTVAPPVAPRELLRRAQAASLGLVLLLDHNRDYRTTKFHELLALRVPLLVLGPEGDVSRFVREHRVGEALPPGRIATGLPALLQAVDGGATWNRDLDLTPWTLDHATDQLIALLDPAGREV